MTAMNERKMRGHVLFDLRIGRGMTQVKAAKLCGVPLGTWRAWEVDRRGITELQLNAIREKLST